MKCNSCIWTYDVHGDLCAECIHNPEPRVDHYSPKKEKRECSDYRCSYNPAEDCQDGCMVLQYYEMEDRET